MNRSKRIANWWSIELGPSLLSSLALMWVVVLSDVPRRDLAVWSQSVTLALLAGLPVVVLVSYLTSRMGGEGLELGGRWKRCELSRNPSAASWRHDLAILAELHGAGKLTDGEYAREKAFILRRWTISIRTSDGRIRVRG